MHSTFRRKELIHGLLLGVAVGDALGLSRENLPRRVALKMQGRNPLTYRLLPGTGIYSDDTQLMLINAQALLQSRSDAKAFRTLFQRRLKWYPFSLPVGAGKATLLAAAKCWLRLVRLPSGVNSAGNGAATRAVFTALAIHGTGHRLQRWVEESTKLTHCHPLAINGCQVLAHLAEYGATCKGQNFDSQEALQKAISASTQAEIKDKLIQLRPFLEQQRGPSAVARHFGWDCGVSGFIVPTTIMATYCYLRYPTNFLRAVKSAILLGGDSDSLAAIVGGLVGAHVGAQHIPAELVKNLGGYPHGAPWMEKLAERLSHWPHGIDDLHFAPSQTSDPLGQLLRNALTIPLVLLHTCLRLPYRLCTPSLPTRLRRNEG